MNTIFFDNNSTTKIDPDVFESMVPYFKNFYGNASSNHVLGRESKTALENSRNLIAQSINAYPEQIFFTSGGTESNNHIFQVLAHKKSPRILISSVEHPSITNTANNYALNTSSELIEIPVNKNGEIILDFLSLKLSKFCDLLCLMLVNNETGVIQPISKKEDFNENIGWFHCDAVQAFGKVPINFNNMPFDSISLSSHKIHGPKGIGALVVKDPSKLPGFILGGMQENSLRAGTESIANIVGFASAAQKIESMLEMQKNHVSKLRNYVEKRLIELGAIILGKNANRVYNTCCFGFKNISGDSLLAELDNYGICLSSGSACSNLESSENYVLKKMGIKELDPKSVIRLSLSINNSIEECEYFLNKCEGVVTNFRQLITI